MSPLHVPGHVAREVVSPLALRMRQLDHPVPVPLRAASVPLEAGAGEDGEAGDRGGGEGLRVGLGPEAVEDKVGGEEEEALGGRGG